MLNPVMIECTKKNSQTLFLSENSISLRYFFLKLESKNGAKIPLFPWYIKKNCLLN